ncbi:DUF4266 domain-containing protein [Akkermansiaceae bacterium]|nr:DUF4266 domain-containing protein [Akkermansiaceae bacterium]MDA8975829.1 DUF4266 domain-containing protein [Akkermansiaceae bacterium]MDB4374177.1 DUF4266 domain-containing protein [Akkermansiaceae bacterium]MDB4554314.1 DUF4266 domain-containing protein [Akkermansiaceae bacterium]MDB4562416.1 DUF4266 domain-containing protein [Akkermansiaceae bacterium]
MKILLALTPLLLFSSCANVPKDQRGYLATKVMSPERDPLGDAMSDHMYYSREASHGGNGIGGGGCGCN